MLATFGSHGDVHPFMGIGLELQRRGHRVVVHTSEYFRPLVEKAGLAFSGFGTAEDFLQSVRNPDLWHRTKAYKTVFGIGVREAMLKSYAELAKMVTKQTLLVNSSLGLSARVLHDELGCPGATIHLSPSVIRSCVAPAKLPGLFMPGWLPMRVKQSIYEVGDKKFIDPLICPTINALRAEKGLGPVERVLNEWWNHPGRIIGLWPEWYGPAASDWPGQFRHAGFPLYDEADVTGLPGELEAFLAEGAPPIAFTPGSAMLFGQGFFKAAVEACRRTGRRGVLLTRHAEQVPKDLPRGVIHVAYAPFSRLLGRCCAVVHHGGIGTTSQGLRAGIPHVVVHFAHDQPDNALRLERLGVGAGMRASRVSGRSLARALSRLLDRPAPAERARALAQRCDGNGVSRAADLLEELLPQDTDALGA